MSEYKEYVTAVNKIFDYLAKMKAGWNNIDNINYIESIEEYKSAVINSVNLFKKEETPTQLESASNTQVNSPKEKTNPSRLEALGND